ncbi:unnamed protein product [Discula destructiva]
MDFRDQPTLVNKATHSMYPPRVSPPLTFINDEDQSGVIAVVSGFSLGLVLLSAVIRVFTKRYTCNDNVQYNDWVFFLAVIIAVIQSVVVCVAINVGLGKATNFLTDKELSTIRTLVLVFDLLYIFIIFLSKAACVLMVMWLSPIEQHKRLTQVVLACGTAWFISSVFLESFRCQAAPIYTNKCNGFLGRWLYIGIVDILIEVVLIATSVYLVWDRRMAKQAKMTVVGAFSCRTLNIVLTIARLAFLNMDFTARTSPFWTSRVFSTTQLAIGCTIMSYIMIHVRALIQAYEPKQNCASSNSRSFSTIQRSQQSQSLRKPSQYFSGPSESGVEVRISAGDTGNRTPKDGQGGIHVTRRIDLAQQRRDQTSKKGNERWPI